MKTLLIAAGLGALLASSSVSAQMVVPRTVGEQVDAPFFQGHAAHRRLDQRHAWRARFVVIRSKLPTPEPFGWFNCCQ